MAYSMGFGVNDDPLPGLSPDNPSLNGAELFRIVRACQRDVREFDLWRGARAELISRRMTTDKKSRNSEQNNPIKKRDTKTQARIRAVSCRTVPPH